MARLCLTILLLALVATEVLSEAQDSFAVKTEDASPKEPDGIITVRVFQPRVFGGVMIRGHCGPIFLLRSIPIIARVTFRSNQDPAAQAVASDSTSEEASGDSSSSVSPWSHGEADGILRAMDSLVALGHPLSLFRDDFSGLSRWHDARMRALDAIRNSVLNGAEEAISNSAAGGAAAASDSLNAGSRAEVAEERSLTEDPFQAVPDIGKADASEGDVPMADEMEWTPLNLAGLALLSLAFGLLVGMLLLSLSSLIYGCAEEDTSLLTPEASLHTPLIKGEVDFPKAAAQADDFISKSVVSAQKM